MWQIWLIAAGIFLIIEIFTVGFFVFWFSIGSLIAMIISFFTSNVIVQVTVFIISSCILIFATKPLSNKVTKKDSVPTNVYSIIGKKAVVVEDIDWTTGQGQVKVNGEIWSAKSNEQSKIPKGSEVIVECVDGVKLQVKALSLVSSSINN